MHLARTAWERWPRGLRAPDPMQVAPALPPARMGVPVPRTALLVNPFYPKDLNASFGKHVLTPTLALTSIAGATPPEWKATYWDENLLQGPPPVDPLPQVVGITVHLTFAKRAYERILQLRRGSAARPLPLAAMGISDERIAHRHPGLPQSL